MDYEWIMKFLRNDISDGNFLRYVNRFLKAGILNDGRKCESTQDSPQGGLISHCIANVYLHYVIDLWFEKVVKRHMKGEAHLIRYVDDLLACFRYEEYAYAFYSVLPKRLAKFGLEVAEDKTRILPFGKESGSRDSFDFLDFSFYNGMARKGFYIVAVRTSKKKLKAKRQAMKEWMRSMMHSPIYDIIAKLNVKLSGHYRYYGVSGNIKSLSSFYYYCINTLFRMLRRRGQKKRMNWDRFNVFLKQRPTVTPRISVKLW